MDKINNFDHAKPLEDMDPKESIISNAGGVTQQKAEEITHPAELEYSQRDVHFKIANKPKEEFDKLDTFQKSVFNRYGLDLNKEIDSKIFDSMSEQTLLERLKILEATILSTMKSRRSSSEAEREYEKLSKEYADEVKRYQKIYDKIYEPNKFSSTKEAEEIVLQYMNPENKSHEPKKELKPEQILEEQMY